MENRAGPTTPSIGVGLTRRTPGIAVAVACLAFAGGKQSLVTSAATNSRDFEQAASVPAVRAWRRQEALLGARCAPASLPGVFAVTNRPAGQKASARRRSGLGSE